MNKNAYRTLMVFPGILSMLSLFFWSGSHADNGASEMTKRNTELAQEIILPDYRRLGESAATLDADIKSLCRDGDGRNLPQVRDAYHQLMDRWQTLQWLRNGPAENLLRHHRMQLWPDKHGTGARQIRKLLLEENPDKLKPESFTSASVAIQGLPAMERILFDEKKDSFIFNASDKIPYRCLYLSAIAGNLLSISNGLTTDWGSYYSDAIASVGDANEFFESPVGVVAEFLSQIATQLQFIYEAKLLRPLNLKDSSIKPRKSESWRSQRSLRNINLNLQSLQQAYTIVFEPLTESTRLKEQINNQWHQTITEFAALPEDFATAYKTQPNQILHASESVKKLEHFISINLSRDIGIPIGFNGLDGD